MRCGTRLTDEELHGEDGDGDGGEREDGLVGAASGKGEGYAEVGEVGGLTVGQDVFVVVKTGSEEEDVVFTPRQCQSSPMRGLKPNSPSTSPMYASTPLPPVSTARFRRRPMT